MCYICCLKREEEYLREKLSEKLYNPGAFIFIATSPTAQLIIAGTGQFHVLFRLFAAGSFAGAPGFFIVPPASMFLLVLTLPEFFLYCIRQGKLFGGLAQLILQLINIIPVLSGNQ